MSTITTSVSFAPLDFILAIDPTEDEKLLIIRAYSSNDSRNSDFEVNETTEHHHLYLAVSLDEKLQKDIQQRYTGFEEEKTPRNPLSSVSYWDGGRYRATFAYFDARFHSDEEVVADLVELTKENHFTIVDADDFQIDDECFLFTDYTSMVINASGLFFSSIDNSDLTSLMTFPLFSTFIPTEVRRSRIEAKAKLTQEEKPLKSEACVQQSRNSKTQAINGNPLLVTQKDLRKLGLSDYLIRQITEEVDPCMKNGNFKFYAKLDVITAIEYIFTEPGISTKVRDKLESALFSLKK
jgi:hypothetical protein